VPVIFIIIKIKKYLGYFPKNLQNILAPYIGFYSILKYYIWRIVKIIKETFEDLKTVVITKKSAAFYNTWNWNFKYGRLI